MTIPISIIAPWFLMLIISFVVGGILNLLTAYPSDPSRSGWIVWGIILYIAQTIAYATGKGWLQWS